MRRIGVGNVVMQKAVHNCSSFSRIGLNWNIFTVVKDNVPILICYVIVGIRFIVFTAVPHILIRSDHFPYGDASVETSDGQTANILRIFCCQMPEACFIYSLIVGVFNAHQLHGLHSCTVERSFDCIGQQDVTIIITARVVWAGDPDVLRPGPVFNRFVQYE